MDNELFELCKEVYERTSWKNEEVSLVLVTSNDSSDYTPKYDSDYILKKLPKKLKGYNLTLDYMETIPETGEVRWDAGYATHYHDGTWEVKWESMESGETPLKALLKLTLVLKDAGELDGQANDSAE